MKLSRLLSLILCSAMTLGAAAQEEVDLQLQRHEDQTVNAVPGHRVDHKGLVINPTPQRIAFDAKGQSVPVAKLLKVKSSVGKGKKGVEKRSGAYRLEITPKGVKITAYDKAGEFYALNTLSQIRNSQAAKSGSVPALTVDDYPELPVRGVVEGFYGTPWSHEARLSVISFFGKNKLNAYFYGPKNDPYHTTPNWRKLYPEADAARLRELIDSCKANMVEFTWAVHPGADIKWTDADYSDILAKFNQLYSLGCRSFAIFFDDIKGEGTNPHKQAAFMNRLTKEFVQKKGDVAPLAMCPTDFTRAWADGSDKGPLAVYGRELDPSVRVMWTGDAVCGDIPKATLDWVNARTRRPALVWWNYPVTDYAPKYLNQGPVYGLDTKSTSSDLCGLLSNPMEYALGSKVAFYGVADYTWNPKAYNAVDSWERSLAFLMPDCPEAYRDFAINCCDTEFAYRRAESWEAPTFTFATYTPEKAAAVRPYLTAMQAAPATIRQKCADKALAREIDPWLTQVEELANRTLRAVDLMNLYHSGNYREFWENYISNRMDSAAMAAYEAHKPGTLKWQPLYEDLMDNMGDGLYQALKGRPSAIPAVIGTFGNLGTPARKKMFDNDTTSVFFVDRVQKEGDFIGVEFNEAQPLNSVQILQGRDWRDVVVFDKAVVEYSPDARQWLPLTDTLTWVRDIQWALPAGKQAPMAKAVRLRKLVSDNQQGLGIREFRVNHKGVTAAFDCNPITFETIAAETPMEFAVEPGAQTIYILGGDEGLATITQKDAAGKNVDELIITGPYHAISVNPSAKFVILKGYFDLYEIIQK